MTIAVAVSGGADSLFALASLAEAGEKVFALHARFLPPELCSPGYGAALERMRASCDRVGVPLHIADCVEAFGAAVIRPFVAAYAAGRTPNPCAHCNAAMKFGLLLETGIALGAKRLATGHYATLRHDAYDACGPVLSAGLDQAKDQSYFLSLVPAASLARALFPLGSRRKPEIRAWLAARGLEVPVPAESQEICFVPNDDYRAFVSRMASAFGIALPGPGPMMTVDGKLVGQHKGLWQYTEGQRKGLGVAWSEPLFVHKKDMAANTLLVGAKAGLESSGFYCANMNFLVPPEAWPKTLLVRTRYRQSPRPASMRRCGSGFFFAEHEPGGPYTAGQLATVYGYEGEGEGAVLRVLAGGIICPEE